MAFVLPCVLCGARWLTRGQELLVGGTVASKPAGSGEALVFPTILQDYNLPGDVAP